MEKKRKKKPCKLKADSLVLAPVAPDFIGEGVLSSHAEGITLLIGHFIMGLIQVKALKQGQVFLDYSFVLKIASSHHSDDYSLEVTLTSGWSCDESSQSLRCDTTFTSYRRGKKVHGRFHVLGTSHANSLFSALMKSTFSGLTAPESGKMSENDIEVSVISKLIMRRKIFYIQINNCLSMYLFILKFSPAIVYLA